STFSEYLPIVALAFVIWSIVGLLSSILLWLPMKTFELVSRFLGLKITVGHLVLYFFVFILIAVPAWIGKKLIWTDVQTSLQLKLTVIAFISCAAILITWRFRDKTELWINSIQERITPLIWLFTFCLVISLSLVGYNMWGKNTGSKISQSFSKSNVSEPDKKRPNILLVTFDALTARHMSAYGYSRNTTPFIKKWAESASLFGQTEAESSYTAATTPSLITGKRTWTHRKYHHDMGAKPLRSETENIALLLKENGYHTSAFIANGIAQAKALGITGSLDYAPLYIELTKPVSIEGLIEKYLYLLFGDKFSTYNWLGQDDFIFTIALRRVDKKVFKTERPPELAFNKFLEMMDNYTGEPFFSWVHIMPPHQPYSPLEPFVGTFNSSWELREKNEMLSINPEINRYKNRVPFPEWLVEKIKLLNDYYDEFIQYTDKQFEEFIGKLQKREWVNNTVILISSDHGESFYKHDYYQHGPPHLYEQVTHIPLIIKEPGQTEGRVIDGVVEQVDIPATILDFANIPVPSWMDGRSLLPLMRDKELPAKTAIAVSLIGNAPADPITKGTFAVWQGDYKLIHFINQKKPPYVENSLLFNLKTDPEETNNLFHKEPVIGQRLLTLIKSNLEEANEKIMADK
ncbi:MAG: sulfatase-like hydrolase/transferase, partial [Thermodesulfovibrionia bacterium]|nr:sulfatase-like hydrolase/transferase [Thermodesulfovibrionia bacterium]